MIVVVACPICTCRLQSTCHYWWQLQPEFETAAVVKCSDHGCHKPTAHNLTLKIGLMCSKAPTRVSHSYQWQFWQKFLDPHSPLTTRWSSSTSRSLPPCPAHGRTNVAQAAPKRGRRLESPPTLNKSIQRSSNPPVKGTKLLGKGTYQLFFTILKLSQLMAGYVMSYTFSVRSLRFRPRMSTRTIGMTGCFWTL